MTNAQRMIGLKAVLWFSAIFHLVAGPMIAFSGDGAATYASMVFGMTLDMTPQMGYVLKSSGLYALAFGALILCAALNPEKHKATIYVTLGLYLCRFFNRLTSVEYICTTFDVPESRAWVAVFTLCTISTLLFIFRPRNDSSQTLTDPSGNLA